MQHTLDQLRNIPVPDLRGAMQSGPNPRAYSIDRTSPFYTDGWVEARAAGLSGINFYHTRPNPPYNMQISGAIEQLFIRKEVAKRLLAVNQRLAPAGLELWLYDAWRPIAVQNYFHDEWMPRWLQSLDPGLQGDALWVEVEKYWSRGAPGGVVDPASPPPHNTGGAVDLTLRHIGGAPLWMGTIFDDLSDRANTTHYEQRELGRSFSDIEARANRRLLYHVMTEQGFTNIWTEWWHFSWGDQRWAVNTGAPAAHYGPMNPCE